MVWKADKMDRLYELYVQYFGQHQQEVIAVNRSLGAVNPEPSGPNRLSRVQFEHVLRSPARYPAYRRVWLFRIIEGHENEFPDLQRMLREAAPHTPHVTHIAEAG